MKVITMTESEFKDRLKLMYAGIANDLTNAIVERCPVDTSMLKQSIQIKPTSSGGFTITAKKYALYVEYGTLPHIIKPKNGKALAFKIGKNDVVVKEVHHPGTRPNPFIRNALHLDLPDIVKNNARIHLLT